MSPCTKCGRFVFPKPTVCFWCRPRVVYEYEPLKPQRPVFGESKAP